MGRFFVELEYEGTRYSGWQIQKDSKTVQGELFDACKKVFKTNDFEFYGSGRTDAGVHALGQVAHLDVNTTLIPKIIRQKLNDELPADINIIEVEKSHPQFHARHSAVARSYVYQISRRRTALGKRYVWWIKDELDVDKMRQASKLFLGMKDFRSFSDDSAEEKSTKVEMISFEIYDDGENIVIHLLGSHFLWKMVRRLVGVLVEVGRGKMTYQDIEAFLKEYSNEPAKFTAPPSGLFLEKIYYDKKQISPNFDIFGFRQKIEF